MTKTFCFHLHSVSAETGNRSKTGGVSGGVGGVVFLSLYAARKKFSEHFVGKKSLTQETWINRDCNNLCYQWDGPGLLPSCITGNPPKEAFWTKRFSRAWNTNCVTKITGNLLQCSANILQETWKFPCLVQNRIPWCSAILFFPRPGCWTNPNTASSPRWYHLLSMKFGIEMPRPFSFCLPALSLSSSQGLLFAWELNLTRVVIVCMLIWH